MDGIRIEVTGNIARVIEKPSRITSGTVGLPIEFTFDSQWDGLRKVAVFRAGPITMCVDNPKAGTTVPWELLVSAGAWLSIGVYGANSDGSVAIPTTWANVRAINEGATPDGDPTTDPTLPIWQTLMNQIASLATTSITQVVLKSSAWITAADGLHSQVVTIPGTTEYSKIDLLPSVEQLAIFHNKDVTFVTENEDGEITVYAIGDKPLLDYTMQVQITEVSV